MYAKSTIFSLANHGRILNNALKNKNTFTLNSSYLLQPFILRRVRAITRLCSPILLHSRVIYHSLHYSTDPWKSIYKALLVLSLKGPRELFIAP